MNGAETQNRHKFDENINLELKNGADDAPSLNAFQAVVSQLRREGESYSLNRESFVRFFNDLTASQQKEFLASLSRPGSEGKSVHDLAQEYNKVRLQSRP